MILIDIGNTTIGICLYQENRLNVVKRIKTKDLKNKTTTLSEEFKDLNFKDRKCLISSVVPSLNDEFTNLFKNKYNIDPVFVDINKNQLFKIHLDNPLELGSDLLMVTYGASLYFDEAIIVDLGTVSKFLVYKGHDFLGGAIGVGFENSYDAIFDTAEMLKESALIKPEKIIETSTEKCLASGIINGMVSLVDGMIQKIKEEQHIENVILTGGASIILHPYFKTNLKYVPDLIFEGMIKYVQSQR